MVAVARRFLTAVALLTALEGAAFAQPPAVVEVNTGDRLTGDVRSLERGRLSFRTPAASTPGARRWAGTIAVLWSEVVSLTSTQNLDVELSSGERFSGSITSPAPNRLVVQTASGPTRPIELRDIVRMVPIEADFRARMTGSIDFGLSYMLAGNARTYTLGTAAVHRSRNYLSRGSVSSWLAARDDAEQQIRNDVALDSRRLLARRWHAVALLEAQQSKRLELDLRLLAGGGAGRTLVQSNLTALTVQGGFDYAQERYAGAEAIDHAAEVFGRVEWDWFPDGTTDAYLKGTTYVSLARQRTRLALDAHVRRDVFGSIYWAVNLFENFDSDPPGGRQRSDFGVAFGIGWGF